jgi:hypothetical protein
MNQKTHVFLHLVVQTVNVYLVVNHSHVLVFQHLLALHQIADLNVFLMEIVHQILLVFVKNVSILVQDHVAQMHNVMSSITAQHVAAFQVLQEIHLYNVL